MEAKVIFGENVRLARRAAGISQVDLAADAQMAKSYLSEVERGRRNPTVEVVGRIALALGISAAVLMDGIPVFRRASGAHLTR
jgi:transcriptional regulator with XRE-family HTH domain